MPRPHGTYSIVALDPATGEVGAAVQSHWFSVGSLCTWARPGIGAVATQSVVEPAHGPHALDRLERGEDAAAALAGVLRADPLAAVRQVGVVDARGGVAVHTGADCIPEAGDVTGEHWTCQANMMARATVPDAMSAAFGAASGDLAERLMTALEGAEAEGGDVRGRQSAALLVAPAQGEPWQARIDLRVEDHADPIGELRRLLGLQRAYELAGEADELMGEGRADEAAGRYVRASELAPDSDELLFWAGLAIAQSGDVAAGADAVRRAAVGPPGLAHAAGPPLAGVRAVGRAVRGSSRSSRMRRRRGVGERRALRGSAEWRGADAGGSGPRLPAYARAPVISPPSPRTRVRAAARPRRVALALAGLLGRIDRHRHVRVERGADDPGLLHRVRGRIALARRRALGPADVAELELAREDLQQPRRHVRAGAHVARLLLHPQRPRAGSGSARPRP